ncbi:radical SAM protein [Streptomyces bungoensis]|uniref:radical SAM protein n=1 Tax=Streptomyces bungoensis TaxID=285568 RepID=UPI00341A52B2
MHLIKNLPDDRWDSEAMFVRYAGREAHFDPRSLKFDKSATGLLSQPDVAPANPEVNESIQVLASSRRSLQRLVLNVANTCNLDCVYCYAQGGDYGGPRERMTFEIGRASLERFFNSYDEVTTVQFFGGEALLNWKVIRSLCEYGWELADRLSKPRPVWMLSTNGTILNDEIIEMIDKYDLKVTVSCDGPPEITDRLRPMRNGTESVSQVIAGNIRKLRETTGQPCQIEGTYTSLHVQEGCRVVDVLDYVYNYLGIVAVHMPPNVLSAEGPHDRSDPHGILPEHLEKVCDGYAEAVAATVRALATKATGSAALLGSAVDIIEELVFPTSYEHPVICPAGSDTIAVDSDGSVYPCFMFYRRQDFRLGHIRAPKEIKADRQVAFLQSLNRRNANSPLNDSWARRFLAGCAGGNFFQRGDHGIVGASDIALAEVMVSAAVVELAHLDEIGGDIDYMPLALRFYRTYLGAPALG